MALLRLAQRMDPDPMERLRIRYMAIRILTIRPITMGLESGFMLALVSTADSGAGFVADAGSYLKCEDGHGETISVAFFWCADERPNGRCPKGEACRRAYPGYPTSLSG